MPARQMEMRSVLGKTPAQLQMYQMPQKMMIPQQHQKKTGKPKEKELGHSLHRECVHPSWKMTA